MNFEKIEKAYDLILENVQLIENEIKTTIYDALIEQNSFYLGAAGASDRVSKNNEVLRQLELSREEWRRAFQFIFIKASQLEPLQANHQFTPDVIGFLILFLMDQLVQSKELDIIEIGSGTGNLAETICNNSQKTINYMGIEIDDLLIDLAASIAEIIGTDIHFLQEDAVRPHILKESDVIIADLPVGFYPNDEIASRYQVANSDGHTYAHHLLIEQSLKYLKKDGIAILIAPMDLLTSEQSPLLKQWLKDYADVIAVITLPDNLFGNKTIVKSIFVLQKQGNVVPETFVYPISDMQDKNVMNHFIENFTKWSSDNRFF